MPDTYEGNWRPEAATLLTSDDLVPGRCRMRNMLSQIAGSLDLLRGLPDCAHRFDLELCL